MTGAGTFCRKSLDSSFMPVGHFDESGGDGKRCAGAGVRRAFTEGVSESCQQRQADSGKYELKFPPIRNTKETMAGKAWISLKIPMLTAIPGGMNIA
ncbi:MAG: hypothetical protein F9K32_10335 [Desulfobulbaceae bacterium]|nr:MAG: hypothetical protein F9K32_10335 [Desulfobulbaceae bacterium]